MGHVNVQVAGRPYTLSCRDGEEARLNELAAYIDRKATDVIASIGISSESRTLLMAAVLIADELLELKERIRKTPVGNVSIAETALSNAAERIEAMTIALEQKAHTS